MYRNRYAIPGLHEEEWHHPNIRANFSARHSDYNIIIQCAKKNLMAQKMQNIFFPGEGGTCIFLLSSLYYGRSSSSLPEGMMKNSDDNAMVTNRIISYTPVNRKKIFCTFRTVKFLFLHTL